MFEQVVLTCHVLKLQGPQSGSASHAKERVCQVDLRVGGWLGTAMGRQLLHGS